MGWVGFVDFGLWVLGLGCVDVAGFGYVLVVVADVGCGLGYSLVSCLWVCVTCSVCKFLFGALHG